MNKEEIERLFEGAIINGISREVVFPELQEEGRIEVELVAPPQSELTTVYISFPADKEK